MLTTRIDKKKIFQYSAVLGVIVLIIVYVLFTNFISKPTVEGGAEGGDSKNITSGIVREVKELNVGIVETEKFKELKENVLIETKIEDLNVGKKNPFSPKATTATTTATSTKKNIE